VEKKTFFDPEPCVLQYSRFGNIINWWMINWREDREGMKKHLGKKGGDSSEMGKM